MEQVKCVLEANGFSRFDTDMQKTIREYDLVVCFKNATSTSVEMIVSRIYRNNNEFIVDKNIRKLSKLTQGFATLLTDYLERECTSVNSDYHLSVNYYSENEHVGMREIPSCGDMIEEFETVFGRSVEGKPSKFIHEPGFLNIHTMEKGRCFAMADEQYMKALEDKLIMNELPYFQQKYPEFKFYIHVLN